ncbi:helix-turn-helix transcriptional regulator [Methylocapsa sp. S129]|uniref:helix-turn-helix transcriptional regulator n=1 Tax=Methylocapsa sp. S129 TaxID=1641869 RepID=UPI00131E4FCA|nr:helix-turn-helix transcriptional regulator [Methylocapsa sp. S129]
MNEQLVDRIYESSFVPELWPGVLDELAEIANARGGVLFAANTEVLRWTASASLREEMARYVSDGWLMRGQRRGRLFGARHAGFLAESDIYSDGELEVDPVYSDFLRPAGLGWAAGTGIPLPTGDMLIVSLERDYERGPVESAVIQQLDLLRPHLARSALLSARMQLERARIASETLALIGVPALVLDDGAKVLAANSLIEALTGFVQWRARDRVSLKDPNADKLLFQAMATPDLTSAATRSFAVRDADSGALMVAHVIPIRGAARDIFVRCAAVLVMTPVAAPQAPPVELVQSLFDLTPAETRVARSLATGQTLDDIASAGGVSRSTVRSHLKAVMEKTGCNRQAEVVALLGGIAFPRV